ncbi:TetR family transcriptional regulator [Demequina capsici]|uniref:TetR family transcriptional regulator n=1 Tax=Demequina capsici TaxID=3075620 RepID=A0AA96FEK7_9MICO|nr:TetR family transcriptional regulator [Demequina sp. PMTSA13]WNM28165.1 TetR family transcriptional regulator [Demequina sp. PMTSA13]
MPYTVKSRKAPTVQTSAPRSPLSRVRVIAEALTLADQAGLDGLSMRALAERLGVVPMALYKHVSNKEELLDALVDAVIAEVAPGTVDGGWKAQAREQLLAARRTMLRHPWAWRAIETREAPSPAALDRMEVMIATLRAGGLSAPLVHHVMHALGSRLWGFSQEVFATGPQPTDPGIAAQAMEMMAARWPRVLESAMSTLHQQGSAVGPGCDDETEYLFAIDLILDGAERLHDAGWSPAARSDGAPWVTLQ